MSRLERAESRTAQYVAFYRALETTERARSPLFKDPYATSFLDRGLRLAVWASRLAPLRKALVTYADRRAPGARTSAIGRTKFIDDIVRAEIRAGVGQLVLLGAGYDARPYRIAELAQARVFEVDQPNMIEMRASHFPRSSRVRRVAIDFVRDDLAATLRQAGFESEKRTIFIWEGVTNYLTEQAVGSVLSFIGGCAPGTTIIFTYIHRGVLDGTERFEGADKLMENVRRLGEPWRFGIHPDELRGLLSGFGIELLEDFGADEYRSRYLGTEPSDLRGYRFYRIAVGKVAPR
ncbi:MAG: SAM-dependent methyltransferase [Polyangiaceae bacterium]|nr:SAM-dependent methyltransferase [Polyangiaceae bacterium]